MTIWSRILAAIGALRTGEGLSAVFDHLLSEPERRVGFAIAVIALGAKMAKADGQVTRDEVTAFREVFSIPPEEEKNAARVFNLARNDVAGYDGYARQIARMFGQGDPALEDVLDGLFHIAFADGEYHPREAEFLRDVAEIFGIGETCFRSLLARYSPDHKDPYAVLSVERSDSTEIIRKRWRALVRETHPDRAIARGMPEEAIKIATDRLAEVNDAYQAIMTERAA